MKSLFSNIKTIALGIAVATGLFAVNHAQAQATRDVSKYNLFVPGENLNGYDPVGYFPEGGGRPQLGSPEISLAYEGVTYNFATPENMDLFLSNPGKYEPTYGQWCAYAMASGSYVKINPLFYTIHGNRLHLFVARRAKMNFDADVAGHEDRADEFWKQISGEEPRN
jgi:hypothetical protein